MADHRKLLAAFKTRNLLERGEWLARILDRFEKQDGAVAFLGEIQQLWRDETSFLPVGKNRDRPDPGLLKAVGYGVGWHHGQPAQTRTAIIFFLLIADHLPPVKDRQYMEEWGASRSHKRFYKLDRVLRNFIDE